MEAAAVQKAVRGQERAPERSGLRRSGQDRGAGSRGGAAGHRGAHPKGVLLLHRLAHFLGRAGLHVLDGLEQLLTELGEEVLLVEKLLECSLPVPEHRLPAESRGWEAVMRQAGGASGSLGTTTSRRTLAPLWLDW